jgi:hypothetical protein
MIEVGFDVNGSMREHNDKNAEIGVNWFYSVAICLTCISGNFDYVYISIWCKC